MAYSNKALPPGTVLREWRLEQVLGVGGFGIVYKGRGIYFDELVAIKEYFPSAISERVDGDTVVPTDSDAEEVHALGLKKFVEEAKLLWNLSKPTRHPNIVSVRSLFEIHGTAYMVMDFEDGRSLSEILKSGRRFSQASLMALIRPIAEGLERAHRVGVLHRDIKPPNILVSEDGRPVLIDFGSARFDSGQATSTKVTFHTPPYAAIEQYVKTYQQGPWTDVYALAVVLYECVAGEKPPEVLERLHGGDSIALADGDWPGFTRAFLRAIDEGMTIRPGDRPQTISQWLALFDLDDDAPLPRAGDGGDDAPTSFAAFRDLPPEIIPVAPPMPVEAPEPPAPVTPDPVAPDPVATVPVAPEPVAPEPAAETPPTAAKPPQAAPAASPPRGKRPVAALLVAGVCVAAAGAGYVMTRPSAAEGPVTASEAAPPVDATSVDPALASAVPLAPDETLAGLHALAAEARRSGTAPAALGAFERAVAQADALDRAPLGAKPRSAVLAEIDALAKPAAASLARAVETGETDRARRVAAGYPWLSPAGEASASPAQRSAARAWHAALQRLAAASARSAAAPGAGEAIAAARLTLAAAGALPAVQAQLRRAAVASAPTAAPTTEMPAPAPAPAPAPVETTNGSAGMRARFAEVDAVVASARPLAARVVEMGSSGRPGAGASSDERKGWSTRQANAKRANEYMSHLELLARTVRAAPSEAAAVGYVNQARTVKGYLNTLLATSLAAMPK